MIKSVIDIAKEASQEILRIYDSSDFGTEYKEDESPVTNADKISHELIKKGLKSISSYPILSEEEVIGYEERKSWDTFWLVDPLDGTKDFIAKNGDFTVNIALIKDHKPILGVIMIPTTNDIYYAQKDQGAFKNSTKIYNHSNRTQWIGADSNFYSTQEMKDFFLKHNINDVRRIGSSIKLCKLAEGIIDVYPRLNGTKEWDTAAAHIIANEAGCKLIDIETKKELTYNKISYKNNYFIASRNDLEFM